MGDDLYIARSFSTAALADISAIQAMENPQSGAAIEQISGKLAQLQSGAKRLRARAIYQSAQGVINGLNPNIVSEDNFTARLSALSKIVNQYVDGLDEIEAAYGNQAPAPETRSDDTAIAGPMTPNQEDLQAAAKATLTELMPLARVGEIAPLQVLMDYDPNATPSQIQVTQTESPQIPLEYLLRDAIQDGLSMARMSGKTISISYDVKQEAISEDALTSLERRLCEGLRALILQSLPRHGVGHIDINLRGKDMVICSKHPQPRLLPPGLKARETANGCELILSLIVEAPAPIVENHPVKMPDAKAGDSAATPIRRPMITDETEGELRAQLKTLLDIPEQDMQTQADELHMDDNVIVMTDKAAKKAMTDDINTGEIGVSR